MSSGTTVRKILREPGVGPAAGKTFGVPDFAVSASASSGLPVSFSASGTCTLSGVMVHLTGAGSCTVTVSQPGDSNFNAATGGRADLLDRAGDPAEAAREVHRAESGR
jgi:hypothetical protein